MSFRNDEPEEFMGTHLHCTCDMTCLAYSHQFTEMQVTSYTIYNEKYFQKVSFCVITHPIGQNGRAVCKKHGNHRDARGAKRRALGAAGRPAIDREFEYSSTYEYSLGAGRPSA